MCFASSQNSLDSYKADAYGGFLNVLFIGSSALSFNKSPIGISASHCSFTSANGININITDALCFNCVASTSAIAGTQAASAFGGSMSVLHVGAHAWSYGTLSETNCSAFVSTTDSSNLRVRIKNAPCFNCSASTFTGTESCSADAYGGSMSVLHIGGTAWSLAESVKSSTQSISESIFVSDAGIHIEDTPCVNCKSSSQTDVQSAGADSYGGAASVARIGAHTWSFCVELACNSNSSPANTSVFDFAISISNSTCINCSAVSRSQVYSSGASTYGGSTSVVHFGAYAYSFSNSTESSSRSSCGSTTSVNISISVVGMHCLNCKSEVTSIGSFDGGNSYGGSISLLYIGTYMFTSCTGGIESLSLSQTLGSDLRNVSLSVSDSSFVDSSTSCSTLAFILQERMLPFISQVLIFAAAMVSSFGANVSLRPGRVFVNLQLMRCLQAYGGSISIMVGPFVRSEIGSGLSHAESDGVSCIECHLSMTNISIRGSAVTSISAGSLHPALDFFFGNRLCVESLRSPDSPIFQEDLREELWCVHVF
jgi:hypothetical protein